MNEVEKILEILKTARRDKKMTQAQVANKIDISKQMYSDYENNKSKMTLELFFKIVKVLELDVFNVPNPVSKQEIDEVVDLLQKIQDKMA